MQWLGVYMKDKNIKKTSINIPIETYEELSRESRVLGINLSALILVKLNQLKQQQDATKILSDIVKIYEEEKKIPPLPTIKK